MNRTVIEWAIELRHRRARLRANRFPWLRELLERLVVDAEEQLRRAKEAR